MNLQEEVNRAKKHFGDFITINVEENHGEIKLKDNVLFRMEGQNCEAIIIAVLNGLNVGYEIGKEVGIEAMLYVVKPKKMKSDGI